MHGHNHHCFPLDFSTLPELPPPLTPTHGASDYFIAPPHLPIPLLGLDNNDKNLLFQLVSSPTQLFDSEGSSSTVTKVYSADDFQGINRMQETRGSESPLSNESNSIIESMNKVCRYSPQEKKERIQRYRTKKSQRNFNKKIQYICRKTLADSRPRVKGRFARYNEIEEPNNELVGGQEGFDMFNCCYSFSSSENLRF